MKPIVAAIILVLWLPAFSQDSLKKWTFTKTIQYWGKWQTHAIDARIKMPRPIKTFRQNNTQLPITFDTITDNPLRHGATYIALQTQSTYRNKISLFADIYGEHRGVSYGLYDQANTVLYPVFRLEAKDTINILSKQIEISGKAGQFLNERLHEGLTIYNIDVQGFQIAAAYKNFEAQFSIYGDLNNGIGLNIDDYISYSLRRKFSNGKDQIGFSWTVARPPYYPVRNFSNFNLFGRKSLGKIAIYAQVGYRPFELQPPVESNVLHRTAFVVGAQTKKEGKGFRYEALAELRYYGWEFDFIYTGVGTRYRKPTNDIYEMYANTVGKYLYPLRKFETPFSQWAVFTEYSGHNILALNLQGKFAFPMSSKIEAGLSYDINFIQSKQHDIFSTQPGEKRTNFFVYPFIEPRISYTPTENVRASLFLSNKAMNLDVAYPTHYLLANAAFGLSVEANF